jgi:hypothetical protein
MKTDDESGVLVLLGLGEEEHGFEDLDAGVCVDIDIVGL